jgi:hypothetical protein
LRVVPEPGDRTAKTSRGLASSLLEEAHTSAAEIVADEPAAADEGAAVEGDAESDAESDADGPVQFAAAARLRTAEDGPEASGADPAGEAAGAADSPRPESTVPPTDPSPTGGEQGKA